MLHFQKQKTNGKNCADRGSPPLPPIVFLSTVPHDKSDCSHLLEVFTKRIIFSFGFERKLKKLKETFSAFFGNRASQWQIGKLFGWKNSLVGLLEEWIQWLCHYAGDAVAELLSSPCVCRPPFEAVQNDYKKREQWYLSQFFFTFQATCPKHFVAHIKSSAMYFCFARSSLHHKS